MNVTGRLRDALRRSGSRVDADHLIRRVEALDRFAQAASPHVPADALRPAHAIAERAGGRLALSRDHAIVALAGATGGGKSSLFNALTGSKISDVGVLRPTTGATHSCVWDGGDDADALLNWLDIPADQRFVHQPSDPEMQGLVLLDLPDFDSIHASHRVEVDRLLRLVDLIVWVTDPQKYADQIIHEQYLHTFRRHVDSTVVVLNQADRLSDTDVRRCLADLTRLLTADGFTSVPVFAVSAVADRPGVDPLRQVLQTAVSERMAALRRLAADVDGAVDALSPLVGQPVPGETINRSASRALADALGDSAGVPAVADATERAYKFRARASMGWPLVRWIRRVRTDPLRRLRIGRAGGSATSDASSLPPPEAAARSASSLAIRSIGEQAGRNLPVPWPAAITNAARSRSSDLPDALDRAVMTTDIGMTGKPWWWRVVGALQWLLTLIGLIGGVWLLIRLVLIGLGLATLTLPSYDIFSIGRVPLATVLLIGGAVAGVLISVLIKPIVAIGAKRARNRAQARLRDAVYDVSQEMVVGPVQQVLGDYAQAREALANAGR